MPWRVQPLLVPMSLLHIPDISLVTTGLQDLRRAREYGEANPTNAVDLRELTHHVQVVVVGRGGIGAGGGVGRRRPIDDLPVAVEGREVGPRGAVGAVLITIGFRLDDVVVMANEINGRGSFH